MGIFGRFAIITTYCTVVQIASGPCIVWYHSVFVRCVPCSAPGNWHVYKTVTPEKYRFVYFTACIRLHLTRWSAGAESKWHAAVTSSFSHQSGPSRRALAHRQGLCSGVRGFLRAESAQETGRGGVSECRGDQHALGACWALRVLLDLCETCFKGPFPKAAGGVEGRDVERGLSLWDCCDVVGIVRVRWCIDPFIVLRIVLRVRCSYSAALLLCESAQLDTLWIDECCSRSDRRIRPNGWIIIAFRTFHRTQGTCFKHICPPLLFIHANSLDMHLINRKIRTPNW